MRPRVPPRLRRCSFERLLRMRWPPATESCRRRFYWSRLVAACGAGAFLRSMRYRARSVRAVVMCSGQSGCAWAFCAAKAVRIAITMMMTHFSISLLCLIFFGACFCLMQRYDKLFVLCNTYYLFLQSFVFLRCGGWKIFSFLPPSGRRCCRIAPFCSEMFLPRRKGCTSKFC